MSERRLAAILAADVAGYSRLMEADEEGTHGFLKSILRELMEPSIAAHKGNLIKTTGDGALVEFASAVDAVRCAMEMQRGIAARNEGRPADKRAELRIGVNVGDIIADEGDIFGDAVNVAARIEGLAEPGGVCISGAVYDHVQGKIDAGFEDVGPQTVKNIARPIQVLRVRERAKSHGVADLSAPVPGFQGRPAIAVLPFQNMSGDPEQEHFVDGIVEDILTRLSMWHWMPVIARNSSFAYKGKSVDVRHIGKELGARYILEGSVRRVGDRVRITGQLIEAETGHHVWADRYDRKLDDIFAIQDEITDSIVTALEPAVGRAERTRASSKPPSNLNAWELYHRGAAHMAQTTRSSLAAARESFHRSIELDLNFALPFAGLSGVGILEVLYSWADHPPSALATILECARRAIALDPLNSVAHRALSIGYLFAAQHTAAISEARRAIELNPSFAGAYHALGVALFSDGQPHEAIDALTRAIRISPNDPIMFEFLGAMSFAYFLAGDYEKSVEIARSSSQKAPQYPIAHRTMASALAHLGRINEAHIALQEFLKLSPQFSIEAARHSPPLRNDSDFERHIEGLRKAGWQG
jgi:adenylate cyclase